MRKTQSYRETKMRLLQKLTGIDWLEASFNFKEEGEREWFKRGYIGTLGWMMYSRDI